MSPLRTAQIPADRNWRLFVLFRVLFNSRFYYPVLALLFLDLGLTPAQYTLLNFAWAMANAATDLPAGVLADRIGRKPLVVAAAVFMVFEMILLGVAPRNGGLTLLLFCLANRILSGMAEGMANGADEALVFDSLAERGRADEWPLVLDQVMRWQSVGMVLAMVIGGALYDPTFMSGLLHRLGWRGHLDQGTSLRFPIFLNLVTALLTLITVLFLREPKQHLRQVVPGGEGGKKNPGAWALLVGAWRWILGEPVALFVIVVGLMLDSTVRLFLTFSSSYFRLIELPEVTYGVIGALFGGLGLLVSPVARKLVKSKSLRTNYLILLGAALLSLSGVALRWAYFGVIFAFFLGATMTALGYMVSYYLHALVDSKHRATVLSIKGLSFNLGYGFISLLFALVLRGIHHPQGAQEAFGSALWALPLWLGAVTLLALWGFRRHLLSLNRVIAVSDSA